MSSKITLNVELPATPQILVKWFEAAAKASGLTVKFVEFCRYFVGRAGYDCRVYTRDEETGKRLVKPGEYFQAPLSGKILYGTQEEADKGFLILGRSHDGLYIRPYSMSVVVDDMLPIPSDSYQIEGHYLPSPSEMAYQTLVQQMQLEPCERIFIVTGHGSSEHALFCFPIRWSVYKDVYLIYSVGGRYREGHGWLFQGNLEDYARTINRGPRSSELDIFFSDRSKYPKFHEAPTSLPMTYEPKTHTWVNPRPVTLRDISEATSSLLRECMESGETYLTGS